MKNVYHWDFKHWARFNRKKFQNNYAEQSMTVKVLWFLWNLSSEILFETIIRLFGSVWTNSWKEFKTDHILCLTQPARTLCAEYVTLKGISCNFRSFRSTGLLVPSADTLLQMWSEMDTQCNLCCDASFCNFERLPPGNTLHTGTASNMSRSMFVTLTWAIIFLVSFCEK